MSDTTNGGTDIVPTDQAPNGADRGEVLQRAPSAARGEFARLAVTPQVKATELVERLEVIREAMQSAMQPNVDYGRIPGTDKPALYKPGAEKLGVLFQLDIQLANEKHWGPGDHLLVISRATVFHSPSGLRLGSGEGTCSTRERKYAYRSQQRTCPQCQATAVIKGKDEYGGGWLCWRKRDGCGATFADGDQSIEGQPVGEIENPDLPDLWNTIVKMAAKRARIDAVLAATGASALFTQDVEDQAHPDAGAPQTEPQLAPEQQQALANGAHASPELAQRAFRALQSILADRTAAKAVGERIANEDGYLSAGAGRTLLYVASQLVRTQGQAQAAQDAAAQAAQARMNAVAANYREHDQGA